MLPSAYAGFVFATLLLAARRSSTSSSIDPAVLALGLALTAVAAIIIIIIYAICNAAEARKNARLDAAADARYRKWQASLRPAGGTLNLPALAAPIHLQKGEVCYFADQSATLLEPRAVRSGGYGGGSIRINRHISLHTGRFASESHDEWRLITTGSLYVTSKRIIFDGAIKNRTVKISDVMSVARDYRCAIVNSQSLQKPLAFGAINGQIFGAIVDAVANQSQVSTCCSRYVGRL